MTIEPGDRWGYRYAEIDGSSARLLRLPEVVRDAMKPGRVRPNGLSLKGAARWVLDGLSEKGGLSPWVLNPAGDPRPVCDADVWRDSMQPRITYLTDDGWSEFPEQPEQRGAAGLIEWLRVRWVDRIASVDDLDNGDLACLAVLERDVARLPWLQSALGVEASGEVSTLRVVVPMSTVAGTDAATQAQALRQRIDADQPMRKTRSTWPDRPAMLAELLRQYEDRMQLPDAASATVEEKLGDLWTMKVNTVHTYLTEARKLRPLAKAA